MSNDYDSVYEAFKALGSVLVRLPFETSLVSLYRNTFTEEEKAALTHALQIAVATLMRSRQYYELGEDAINACAAGVASELAGIFIAGRVKYNSPRERMHVDGYEWELMFDPGPMADGLRTDERGRVWRRLRAELDESDDLPF